MFVCTLVHSKSERTECLGFYLFSMDMDLHPKLLIFIETSSPTHPFMPSILKFIYTFCQYILGYIDLEETLEKLSEDYYL